MLAVGCSFTDPNFSTLFEPDYDCSFPKWPELLANKLNVDVVNLGHSGASNEWIINTAIDHILDNKPWLVTIGLTEAWRYSVYSKYWINPIVGGRHAIEYHDPHSEDFCPFLKSYFDVSKTLLKDLLFEEGHHLSGGHIRRNMFFHYFENIIRLQKICKRLDVKLIITPLLWPLAAHPPTTIANQLGRDYDYKELEARIAGDFLNTSNFDDVDSKTCLGWPWLEELGGTFPTHFTSGWRMHGPNSLTISEEDGHPNALGHQLIAEKFYEFYVKNYSEN